MDKRLARGNFILTPMALPPFSAVELGVLEAL
jgi:hypothetical protein